MKIRMTYKIQNEATGNEDNLSDVLNWPDISTLADAKPHIIAYLDQKWGQGRYLLLDTREEV